MVRAADYAVYCSQHSTFR